jgi:hypothetical protein
MEWLIDALVLFIRLALAGFLIWGGWLCLGPAAAPLPAKEDGFERAASLVLLALLCTTIAGVP